MNKLQESVNDDDDDNEEDDGVILIDDDGEMERLHSSADLSMDEAHGEDGKHAVVVDDVETSTAEVRVQQTIQGALFSFELYYYFFLN